MTTPNFGQTSNFPGIPSYLYNVYNAAIQKEFSTAFAEAAPQASFVEDRSTSGKYINLAGTMAAAPVHIWRNDKTINRLNHFFQPVPMFPLETTIAIDKFDMMGDVMGLIGDDVKNLGAQAGLFKDVFWPIAVQSGYPAEYAGYWQGKDAWDMGESGNITGDGLPLFATNHTFGPLAASQTAQSNIVTGSLSDPTTWATARSQMQSFTNDQGFPLRVRASGVVYGSPDEFAIYNALKATQTAVGNQLPVIAAGGTGHTPQIAMTNVIISMLGVPLYKLDTLDTNPGVAYLIGEIGAVKSSYCYMMEQCHLVPSVDPSGQPAFKDRNFMWSVEGYGRVVCPTFFTIIRVVDTTIAKYV